MSGIRVAGAKRRRRKQRRRTAASDPGEAKDFSFQRLLFTREHLVLLSILLLALVLRAYRLATNFPIVGDESIYLRWAEIIEHQGQWFISLLDGKQPLSYWIYALTRFAGADDPLVAGRSVSVAAGLLTAVGIYFLCRKLAGASAGLLGALFYAVLPWAVMYDRFAYAEPLVNLSGVAIVYSSISCFQDESPGWKTTVLAGLTLGLGFFVKSTALLFSFFPALAGVWLAGGRWGRSAKRMVVIYGVALIFPLICWFATPDVPVFESTSMIFHQSHFFIEPLQLLKNPFIVAPHNFRLLLFDSSYYVTWPTGVAALLSLIYLARRRFMVAWLVVSASLLPLTVQIFILKASYAPRYAFPHIWPLLAVTSIAMALMWEEQKAPKQMRRARLAIGSAAVLLVAGPMFARSVGLAGNPRDSLPRGEASYFLGSHVHAGFGVRGAIDFLVNESKNGPFVLLTDAFWSIPADAMFPYLNRRHGIRVHETWWTQLSAEHPIMPENGKVDLLRSHWERVKSGELDFSKVQRVYYVTDSVFNTEQKVHARQPTARLLRSFPRPGGHSTDVYRLK